MVCPNRALLDLELHFSATLSRDSCLEILCGTSTSLCAAVLKWDFCRQASVAGGSNTRYVSSHHVRGTQAYIRHLLVFSHDSPPPFAPSYSRLQERQTNSWKLSISRWAHSSQIKRKWNGDWNEKRCLQSGAAGLCNSVELLCLLRSTNLCNVMVKIQQRGHKSWHQVKTQYYHLGRAL